MDYRGADMLIAEGKDRLAAREGEVQRLLGVILSRDQQIIRLQAGLQAIANMDKYSGASLRQRAASELARKTLKEN